MPDPNMPIAYALAQGLGPPPGLPASLTDVQARARLVKAVDRTFAGEDFQLDTFALLQRVSFESGRSIRAFIDTSAPLVPDVPDPVERLNLVLRLWAGCLMAAKPIAYETRSEENPEDLHENTPEDRQNNFAMIDEVAKSDPIFEAGVEAAPAFKDEMEQPYSLDGVPDDSPVRRYAG